jgi:hypothetical protein
MWNILKHVNKFKIIQNIFPQRVSNIGMTIEFPTQSDDYHKYR